jgi:hypothetical protein
MPDQKIDIEIELQDKASETIKAIAVSMSEVVKHIGEMGKASTGTDSGIAHTVKSVKQLGDKSKETTKCTSRACWLVLRVQRLAHRPGRRHVFALRTACSFVGVRAFQTWYRRPYQVGCELSTRLDRFGTGVDTTARIMSTRACACVTAMPLAIMSRSVETSQRQPAPAL